MNAQITKHDVVLYFAGELDTDRRREIEAAWETDQRVRTWFADLAPTGEELEREPAPVLAFEPHDPKMREIFAAAYFATEREGWMSDLAAWFHDAAASATRIVEFAVEFAYDTYDTLVEFANGAMTSRSAVPLTAHADSTLSVMRKIEPPCIRPDYSTGGGRLAIAQWTKDVPSGVVDVFAAKRIESGRVQVYGPVRVKMYGGTHQNMKYWYADISLRSLVGDYKPGDEFFYYVEPVAEGGGEKATNP